MAHFAELDEDNIVLRTIVVHNDVITKEDGSEDESLGVTFLKSIYGDNTNWKQTSYHAKFRRTFAGKGAIYDEEKDIFHFPQEQPFDSWKWNEEQLEWEPPIPRPPTGNGDEDGHLNLYEWNNINHSWITIEIPLVPIEDATNADDLKE
tara:strand:+ start:163 stop:609 length:447 start_codon:yes stop_codon:yes gene_type:complete